MQVSQRLTDFVATEEGVVTKAYRDPVGILTIGAGHTTAAGGLVVKAGMTITRQQALNILSEDLMKFMARCDDEMPTAEPHELEGATSFDFNTGAIHKASWVDWWMAEDDKEARRRLLLWNKAGGKRLKGLAARRAREANIIFLNKWPVHGTPANTSKYNPDLANSLIKLGHLRQLPDAPKSDRVYGPSDVKKAVKAFQHKNGLVVDGVVGPATRATLQRVLAAKKANEASVITGAASGSGAVPFEAIDSTAALAIVAGVVVAGIALGWAYRNRGRLFGVRSKITSGEA